MPGVVGCGEARNLWGALQSSVPHPRSSGDLIAKGCFNTLHRKTEHTRSIRLSRKQSDNLKGELGRADIPRVWRKHRDCRAPRYPASQPRTAWPPKLQGTSKPPTLKSHLTTPTSCSDLDVDPSLTKPARVCPEERATTPVL
jgi:hypothetical protein